MGPRNSNQRLRSIHISGLLTSLSSLSRARRRNRQYYFSSAYHRIRKYQRRATGYLQRGRAKRNLPQTRPRCMTQFMLRFKGQLRYTARRVTRLNTSPRSRRRRTNANNVRVPVRPSDGAMMNGRRRHRLERGTSRIRMSTRHNPSRKILRHRRPTRRRTSQSKHTCKCTNCPRNSP